MTLIKTYHNYIELLCDIQDLFEDYKERKFSETMAILNEALSTIPLEQDNVVRAKLFDRGSKQEIQIVYSPQVETDVEYIISKIQVEHLIKRHEK